MISSCSTIRRSTDPEGVAAALPLPGRPARSKRGATGVGAGAGVGRKRAVEVGGQGVDRRQVVEQVSEGDLDVEGLLEQ